MPLTVGEGELGVGIDQLFGVGDLGLFLAEEDRSYLIGRRKHKRPVWCPKICEAWQVWRWPTAAIGGNHEPADTTSSAPAILPAPKERSPIVAGDRMGLC